MDDAFKTPIGISAIAIHEPSWRLDNHWFAEALPRKFVHHTGIEARLVSDHDEIAMGRLAVRQLQRETRCDLADCAALVFVSPSFVPLATARRHLRGQELRRESLGRAAHRLADQLGIRRCPAWGLNWFCSGYSKALAIVRRQIVPRLGLDRDQFVLVINASRISRITDYGCNQSGPLFGDMATATLVARTDSYKYPVHFRIQYAHAEKQSAPGVYFDFQERHEVPLPEPAGGRSVASSRLVFRLDGMGIADIAPRAMSAAVAQALTERGLTPDALSHVVPHQAGNGIIRLTTMKLEQLGVRCEVLNGLARDVGNVSSCSVPYALKKSWWKLSGLIACPTAAVGLPGQPEVSQGCVLLEATPAHAQLAKAS